MADQFAGGNALRTASFPPVLQTPSPTLSLKPDMPEAARRWDAYFAGEIIDRPLVCVTAPLPGEHPEAGHASYRDNVFGDPDAVLRKQLAQAEATYWGGEAIPSLRLSYGPDEIAVFCGAAFSWSDASGDTNWSEACVDDWEQFLPFGLRDDSPLWRQMPAYYRRASELAAGKVVMPMLDLHSNMDLLSALRGPQRLCTDLLDAPETVDRAMESARDVFPALWDALWEAGRIAQVGYGPWTCLQCDFSCMVGPAMFRRWILPALEEEAAIVGRVVYHWDGPGALVHTADLVTSRGLHTLSYVPGDGRGGHVAYLDLFKRVQAGGKAVAVHGTPDEVKLMHRELRPEKTAFHSWVGSPEEADALLQWFVDNT